MISVSEPETVWPDQRAVSLAAMFFAWAAVETASVVNAAVAEWRPQIGYVGPFAESCIQTLRAA
jgi:hypothetical protein